MKLTLLDMTQNILSAMNSDEVNSHTDTSESRQVAEVIKTAYFNIIARSKLPKQFNLFKLEASGEMDQPVLMYIPSNVKKVEWIKYDKEDDVAVPATEPDYEYVTILPIQQFLDMVDQFDPDETNVESFTLTTPVDTFRFYFKNDQAPTYCTILDNYYVIFDTYDSNMDGTLQESKTRCYGETSPTFLMEDNFIPDLDTQQFPLLLNEAKSLAFLEMKQTQHDLAIREANRQWRTSQHTKFAKKPNYFNELPNYGRK